MAERCWKPCFVRLRDHTLYVFNNREDARPIQVSSACSRRMANASRNYYFKQPTLCLTPLSKHTTFMAKSTRSNSNTSFTKRKLESVPVCGRITNSGSSSSGQISRLVEGHVTKYGLPLEHSAQCNVLLKFGSLDTAELQSFVTTVEDILFQCPAKRDTKPIYKQDEVQVLRRLFSGKCLVSGALL